MKSHRKGHSIVSGRGHSIISGLAMAILICALAAPGLGQTPTWSKYVPKKQRGDTVKKSIRANGVGGVLSGNSTAAIWVTEPMARCIVSDAIDHERLTPEEADKEYADLRPEESHCFLVNTVKVTGGLLPAPRRIGPPRQPGTVTDPLSRKEVFLQRAENREQFSKGTVADHQFDVYMGPAGYPQSAYVLLLPKNDRSGQPIIRALTDKIELQFTIEGRKVVFEYKLKDLVASLDDL